MRAAQVDILVIPGYLDSGPDHWQSRWERKLSTARRVAQRDFSRPVAEEWAAAIRAEVARATRPVVCVAHSLGVAAFLHAGVDVAGAFLVAPPSESVALEMPAVDPAFVPYPRRRLNHPAMLVASSADPYADLLFPRDLARDLGAEFVDAGAAGHINVDSGHGPWPEGSIRFAALLARL